MDNRDLIARAVLIKDGALLVNQNFNRNTGQNYVALPGGHVDPGEDCKGALLREIEEELSASATIGDLVFVSESIYAGRNRGETQRHELTLIFAGEIEGETSEGRRVLSPEGDKNFIWLPLTELEEANLLPANIKAFLLKHDSARYNFTDSTRPTS